MKDSKISERLVEHGKVLFNSPKQLLRLQEENEANILLNDLDKYPHAFVLGCIMDRQIKAEKAWLIPYRFKQKMNGDFSIQKLSLLSLNDITQFMTQPRPLHRFVNNMSKLFHIAIHRIAEQYEGNAAQIWKGNPSSAEVVYRFLEFNGVSLKIASMAANILARDFKIHFAEYHSIDISVDRHVRRVFGRLGLTPNGAPVEQIIFKARAMHPEFPGLMDYPCLEIGNTWCNPNNPQCQSCYMNDICPKIIN